MNIIEKSIREERTVAKPVYGGLFGTCRRAGFCVNDCGLCKYIRPAQTPSYKAANQAYRYKQKREKATLFSPDTEGVEIGYKEPLRPVEDGYGYFGTITIDKNTKTCVQCHKCGFYFAQLGQHIKEHGYTPKDYKRDYGLSLSKPLLSEKGKRDWSGKHSYNISEEQRQRLRANRIKAAEAQKTSQLIGKDSLPLEYYNRFGICPDQLIDKYLKLKEKLGVAPSYREMAKEYKTSTPRLLMKVFGTTWEEVKKELG